MGSIEGLDFEDICCDMLEGCGFSARRIGGQDGGRDIIIRNGRNSIVVECKHQKDPVGRPVVQKLHSAVITERAAGGMVVSTGGFSPQAKKHASVARRASNVMEAIRLIIHGEILLVGRSDLDAMAADAGIRLHDGIDPSTDVVDTDPLKKQFAQIRSHPKSAATLMNPPWVTDNRVVTCWVANFQVEQDFRSSTGVPVHRMRKKGECMCGPDGKILKGKFAAAVKKGGDASPEKASTTAAKKCVVEHVQSKFTKTIEYRGRNGATYTMKCEPGPRHIRIRFEPVGLRQTSVSIKFLRTTYKWKLPDWGKKIECRICGGTKSMFKPLLLCNSCGKIVHDVSCGGNCHTCSKTICDSCARKRHGIFGTKRFCSDCM